MKNVQIRSFFWSVFSYIRTESVNLRIQSDHRKIWTIKTPYLDTFHVVANLKFIRPSPNSIFDCRNPKGICLITRLTLGLCRVRNHRFKHSSQDTLNPLCTCANDVESREHFPLHCLQFVNERRTFLSNSGNFNYNLLENISSVLTQTLVFGNMSLNLSDNSRTLIFSTKRFNEPLFQPQKIVIICF